MINGSIFYLNKLILSKKKKKGSRFYLSLVATVWNHIHINRIVFRVRYVIAASIRNINKCKFFKASKYYSLHFCRIYISFLLRSFQG